ncbi:MAG: bifunctional pyr operon transcriptional regulator/uracil phosphoribosyltransferase PyrR [Flavobacteriales bacterium]|nr:bifunctional pyr operon transcriptional regulator/uracil phosphoribosyltransferase PyrR [Flavobacteriales bacterium]MCX7769298.1 bifunctional pyr operon transcriptional regulator/uracil phosphoribosyltransferase PyrR [Flavobacteriales bacterium]MDW8410488.1 bifunctional pyr operon transcriptional regulator/uracil phosphoribosyltransferase PyrR [Flavobacteriales bacterium]
MTEKILISTERMQWLLERLCLLFLERHDKPAEVAVLALQPRGVAFGQAWLNTLSHLTSGPLPDFGKLDITFHRDDYRKRDELSVPSETHIPFPIEGRPLLLMDDVLYTGRSVRAGLDALLSYGRPTRVELMVLVERRFSRELPIEANYVGERVDTLSNQKVRVLWEPSPKVVLYSVPTSPHTTL